VHFLLKMNGVREVEMGLGDQGLGGFVRPLRVAESLA
jgi:hypothetical protein